MHIRRDIMRAVLGVLLLFSLVGCGARGAAGGEEVGVQGAEGRGEPRLSEIVQVLLGTFRLENTEYAVSGEQATELLPLWKAYRTLLNSDAASPQETDALIKQIVDTMSDEQMSAIKDMELGQGEFTALMEEQGLTLGRQRAEESDKVIGQGGPAGGFVGGTDGIGPGMGGGGGAPGGMAGGGELPSDLQTRRAEGGGAGMMVDSDLIEAVIEFLANKV